MIVYGTNPVLEALRAGRVREVRVSDRAGARLSDVVKAAEREGIPVRRVTAAELERASRGGVHQGVIAEVEDAQAYTVAEIVAGAARAPLVIVLDGVEDPHNVGAILRTVDAAGADGVIRQSRHAAPLEGAAAKASAGAVSHVKVADVVNIARAIEELKALGVWTVGLAGGVERTYEQIDMTLPTAFVLGGEGSGLRRLVRESCDWVVSIPLLGHVDSLNVSVAAGVALFEAVRQRRSVGGGRSG